MANFQDQTLQCADCGKDFVWTAAEQEFYESKGFNNPPRRCQDCRALKKAQMGGQNRHGGGDRGSRQMFEAVCAQCGKKAMVPFQPRGDKPVYCRDCFMARQQAA